MRMQLRVVPGSNIVVGASGYFNTCSADAHDQFHDWLGNDISFVISTPEAAVITVDTW